MTLHNSFTNLRVLQVDRWTVVDPSLPRMLGLSFVSLINVFRPYSFLVDWLTDFVYLSLCVLSHQRFNPLP